MSLGLRSLILGGGILLWFLTQRWIGQRRLKKPDQIFDWVHEVTDRWNQRLHENEKWGRVLLISTSLGVDAMGIFLFYRALFSDDLRVLLSIFLLFALRQISQGLTALPAPPRMLWRNPGFPSFLVTYGVSNDLFFSGHTALAVLGGMELIQSGNPILITFALAFMVFEIMGVLVLRAHWTMDVIAGIFAALFVHQAGARLAECISVL